ncbi:hypothetical protein DFH07DRAFT_774410 [Mycena maculata]|uniref:Ubiquitin-like domain-containing protein n=1 Tax=Mycena maculata TaxID=230809 RepID=A0AAD7IXE3_9AGAR|nr:hypothetical protein DFH07DRAFT_774410 [Mycena maculata]
MFLPSAILSFGDIVTAAEMALKIVQVLYYSPNASDEYQGALAELVSLHHELTLINDAIQLDAASGPAMATELAGCYAAMQRFLKKTEGMGSTGVVGILNKVWWAASEEKELMSLRGAISRHRAALGVLISSSNFIISTTTRDEVRACRDSIQDIATMVKHVPHPVSEDMVFVIDPLGEVIRISMIYGLKFEDLHRIVQAYYPKDRAGSQYISDGSYHLLHSANGRISPVVESSRMELKPGMTLEMSIVLCERGVFLDQRRTCPRCKKQGRSEIISETSWRKWSSWTILKVEDRDLIARSMGKLNFHRKEGPKKSTEDDGVEHFRRIEFICVEDKDSVESRFAQRLDAIVDMKHRLMKVRNFVEERRNILA